MIKLLKNLLENLSSDKENNQITEEQLHLATAALLVEVAAIDQHFDEQEWSTLHNLLKQECHISDKDAEQLIDDAQQASENSTSLYDFTQFINQICDYKQKITLVNGLWKVAYADNNLDKYEEHIVRRIADLIHVSHKDFIQEKINVRNSKKVKG